MRLLVSRKEQTTPGIRWSPTQILILEVKSALRSLSFGVRGVKKQGVSRSKNGRLIASVSAVRFTRTVKPAVPQNQRV